MNNYDLIIIGGGPAGLTAGIYASRARLKCLLLEKGMAGGQMLLTDVIENFPGFASPVKGADLAGAMAEQAKAFGLNMVNDETIRISAAKSGGGFEITSASGDDYRASSVIIASGASWKSLEIPGEAALRGKGVSYCAICDGPLFKGKDIVVVGGGDKALEEALYLSRFAASVRLVHRRDRFRAVSELRERVAADKKIIPVLDSVVTEITGKDHVDAVRLSNVKTGKTDCIPVKGVFIFIGITPNSAIAKGLVDMDEKGFIIAGLSMQTSREGVYACGDVIKKSLYQISTAVGEGATSAFNAQKYVEGLNIP